MKTRTKFAIVDTMLNYFLFTPLVLLFWYGTYALIDALILSQFESRLIGAILTLVIGFYIEFTITYWQVCTANVDHSSSQLMAAKFRYAIQLASRSQTRSPSR